jgi:hypothetical protein
METRQAIISFSQSEKVKSGLIWCTQCTHILQNMPAAEHQGAMRILQALVAMIGTEVQVARQASGDQVWLEVDRCLNNARVMVDSGVGHEADFHLTQALSQVNRIGQKAMTFLMENGLI